MVCDKFHDNKDINIYEREESQETIYLLYYEKIDRRCIVFDAIRVIIYHYPANVYPRHLMGHQAGPRYSISHSGRRKIGANFRYIVGQLYGDRRSSDIVQRRGVYTVITRRNVIKPSGRIFAINGTEKVPPNSCIRP